MKKFACAIPTNPAYRWHPIVSIIPDLSIFSLTPGHGPPGTHVVVFGSGFSHVGLHASLNLTGVSGFTVVNDGRLEFDVPDLGIGAGSYDLSISHGGGPGQTVHTSFGYEASAGPIVSAVSYALADTLGGGQRIVVTVDSSVGCTAITGGGVAFSSFAIDDATHVSGIPGAHAAGVVDVQVTNASGTGTLVGAIEYWDPTVDPAVTLLYDSLSNPYNSAAGTWAPRFGTDPTLVTQGTHTAASAGAPSFDGDGANEAGLVTTGTLSTYVSANNAGGGSGHKLTLAAVTSGASSGTALDYTSPFVVGVVDPGSVLAIGDGMHDFGAGPVHCVMGMSFDTGYKPVFVPSPSSTATQHAVILRVPNDGTAVDLSVDGSLSGALHAVSSQVTGQADAYVAYPMRCGMTYPGGSASVQLYNGTLRSWLLMNANASDAFVTKYHQWAQQRFGAA